MEDVYREQKAIAEDVLGEVVVAQHRSSAAREMQKALRALRETSREINEAGMEASEVYELIARAEGIKEAMFG